MAEEQTPAAGQGGRSKDEIALDLMKFIAVETGYARGTGGAGFGAKGSKSPEEQAEALIQLYERCRAILGKAVSEG